MRRYWDVRVATKYVQVKSHAKALQNKSRFSRISLHEGTRVDELVTVVFSTEYKLKEFYQMPWTDVLKLARRTGNGTAIYWHDQLEFKVNPEELPNQDLVRLFCRPAIH